MVRAFTVFIIFVSLASTAALGTDLSPATWSSWESRDSESMPNKQAFIDLLFAIDERDRASSISAYSWQGSSGGGWPATNILVSVSNYIGAYASGTNVVDLTPFWFVQGGKNVQVGTNTVYVNGPREAFSMMVGRVLSICEYYKPPINTLEWLNKTDENSAWTNWYEVPTWALAIMRADSRIYRACLPTYQKKWILDDVGEPDACFYAEGMAYSQDVECEEYLGETICWTNYYSNIVTSIVGGFPASESNDQVIAEWIRGTNGEWSVLTTPFAFDDATITYDSLGIHSEPSGASGSVTLTYSQYNTNAYIAGAPILADSMSDVYETEQYSSELLIGENHDGMITEVAESSVSCSDTNTDKLVLKYVGAKMYGGTEYGDWSVTWAELWKMRDVISMMTSIVVEARLLIDGDPYSCSNGAISWNTNVWANDGDTPENVCEDWFARGQVPSISCADMKQSVISGNGKYTNGCYLTTPEDASGGIYFGYWDYFVVQGGQQHWIPHYWNYGSLTTLKGLSYTTKGIGVFLGTWDSNADDYLLAFEDWGITANLATTDFYMPSDSGMTNGKPRENPVVGSGLYEDVWSGSASCEMIEIVEPYDPGDEETEYYTNRFVWIIGNSSASPAFSAEQYISDNFGNDLLTECETTYQVYDSLISEGGCDDLTHMQTVNRVEGYGQCHMSAQAWIDIVFDFE